MRIALLAPYGPLSQESGIIYLLGNYLSAIFPEVTQLTCNGVFSVCDRDSESNWKRGFDACLNCISDQAHLSRWSRVPAKNISPYLTPQIVENTARWLNELPTRSLLTAEFDKTNVYDLVKASFNRRFLVEQPDLQNKQHELVLRRMLLSALRMNLAAANFNKEFKPDLIFVAGGKDLLTASFCASATRHSFDSITFRWDMHNRCVNIQHPRKAEPMSCDLLMEGISHMRPDQRTWPRELLSVIEDVLAYLEIEQNQLTLPMARAAN